MLSGRQMNTLYHALVRWAFERFYREGAWAYDVVAALVSGGHWRAWALSVLPHLSGRVLELGCGTANLQLELAGATALSFSAGVDRSPQMLAIARRKARRLSRALQLVRAEAGALPFATASFEYVVATFPSEYIVDRATLAEVKRVLAPGGRLLIVLAAQLEASSLYRRLVELAYRATLQRTPRDLPAAGLSPVGRALAGAGFRPHERWVAAPGGRVFLIDAEGV